MQAEVEAAAEDVRAEEAVAFRLADGVLEQRAEAWKNSVLICDDISCGVVPLEAETRAWREACGRMLNALSRRADTVTRIFCGLPQRLK